MGPDTMLTLDTYVLQHKIASLRRNLRAQLEADKAKLSVDLVNLTWVVKSDLIGDQAGKAAIVALCDTRH
jgi:hypothetical protein